MRREPHGPEPTVDSTPPTFPRRGPRRRRGIVLGLVLLGSGACGAPRDAQPRNAGEAATVELDWTLEEVYAVGGVGAADDAAIGDVGAVAFGRDGRLYVIDGDAGHVVVFDATGRVVGTLGQPGEGPGSLAWPTGLVVKDDGEVVVLDAARRRWVRFGPEGDVLPGVAIPEDVSLPGGPLALHPSGRVMGTRDDDVEGTGPRAVTLHPAGGRATDTGQSGRVAGGSEAAIVWIAWRPVTPESRALTPEETGGLRVRLPPLVGFHPHVHAVPLPDGRIVVADSTDYRLRVVAEDGTVVRSLGRSVEPTPVTEAFRAAERERRLAELEADPPAMMVSNAAGQSMGVADDPVMRLERARIDAMGFHEEVPVVAGLMVDPEGRLWVLRAGAVPGQPGAIDVFDQNLDLIGTLPASAAIFPAAFGPDGRVAHVALDDFGAPVVTVSRWVR
jgi:hypothetical protein